jgi:outer membrane lipoprotein-sorting protein
MKLSPDYAPAYYLFGLVDLMRDERLDEALEMARKAHRLQPAKASYTLLLAEAYARRSDPASARELAEPLTRDSDAAIRQEAQNVLDSLDGRPNRSTGASRATVSSALDAEPVQPTRGGVLIGGASGGTTIINDGQTIVNSGSLPSLDEVLAHYVEASGGEKVIAAVTSRVVKGNVDVTGLSHGGSYESYQQAPNKFYFLVQAYPFGIAKSGYNGRVAWTSSNATTTIVKNAADVAYFASVASFFSPVALKQRYAKVTLAGTSQIGFRDVYVLELQPAAGTAERLYLDTKTYLPVRFNKVQTLGNAKVPVEIYLDDWHAVDGIQFPFTITESMPKQSMSFTITEIRHNVPIDATLFDPPKQ